MKSSMFRGALLLVALVAGFAAPAFSQASRPEKARLTSFATAEAAAEAMKEAIRHNDDGAMAGMFGDNWRELVPASAEDHEKLREKFLAGWEANHKIVLARDGEATVQVGTSGWVMPVPIVKQDDGWRFDLEAGRREITARRIGHNELAVIQTMLAIVDAEREYAALDPMKIGVPVYARRLLSSPNKKDGLYWEASPGEQQSPLGPALAKAQARPGEKGELGEAYYGYHFRLLYGQGPAAHHGAREYIIRGKMIGGFAAIAWPVVYGETGVMTFIVNQRGEVFEQDLGAKTVERAEQIVLFNPDNDWSKADMMPP